MFCPDCGRKLPEDKHAIRYCPDCGEKITGSDYFCRNCGAKIRTPKKESQGFLDKHKTLIIIIAVILAVAIVAIGASALLTPTSMQEVQVDTFDFSIPEYFTEDTDMAVDETDEGIRYVTRYWQSDEDFIQIDVMYAEKNNVDAEEVADYMGGEKENLMGCEGYFNELEDAYSFSFVKDNKLVTLYTSSMDLFDEIEVV